jgi:hypothetical protein
LITRIPVPRRVGAAAERLDATARRDAWRAFLASRLVVLLAAVVGVAMFPAGSGLQKSYPGVIHPFESWPLGNVFDFLLSPFIRGDAPWYLLISEQGYEPEDFAGGGVEGRPAFFPVYPLLVKALGGFAGFGVSVVVAVAISLVSLLGALYLLHRLTALELGPDAARATVTLVAFSPVAYFFSAPYTESLFLLLSVGSVYAARRRNWALAAGLAAVASGTRNVGVFLIIPLALMYLHEERPWERLRPNVLWLALSPLGLIAFSLYLRAEVGDAQAWRHRQAYFGRPDVVDPIEGIRSGTEAAFDALTGSAPAETQVPTLLAFGFLVFAAVAVVGLFRTLPLAYGAYSLAVLLPAICTPYADGSLAGLPRYTLAAFPVFMWLGWRCERAGVTDRVVLGFACLLALLTAGFVSWQPLG